MYHFYVCRAVPLSRVKALMAYPATQKHRDKLLPVSNRLEATSGEI